MRAAIVLVLLVSGCEAAERQERQRREASAEVVRLQIAACGALCPAGVAEIRFGEGVGNPATQLTTCRCNPGGK